MITFEIMANGRRAGNIDWNHSNKPFLAPVKAESGNRKRSIKSNKTEKMVIYFLFIGLPSAENVLPYNVCSLLNGNTHFLFMTIESSQKVLSIVWL